MLSTRPILYLLSGHHLFVHTTSTNKKCIGILCHSQPSCTSSKNWSTSTIHTYLVQFLWGFLGAPFRNCFRKLIYTMREKVLRIRQKNSPTLDYLKCQNSIQLISESLLATITFLWISQMINNRTFHYSACYVLNGSFCGALV